MADAPTQLPNLYSIIVIGAMNSRIHHPLWYRVNKFIDPASYERAISEPEPRSAVITAEQAAFATPAFTILCQPNRWEIHTAETDHREQILQVAKGVFEKLSETTVDRYGFNTALHRPTSCPNVGDRLGQMLDGLGFGLGGDGQVRPAIVHQVGADPIICTTQISGSQAGPNFISVAYNTNRKVVSDDVMADNYHFDLGKLMTAHYDSDYRHAVEVADRAVKVVSEGT